MQRLAPLLVLIAAAAGCQRNNTSSSAATGSGSGSGSQGSGSARVSPHGRGMSPLPPQAPAKDIDSKDILGHDRDPFGGGVPGAGRAVLRRRVPRRVLRLGSRAVSVAPSAQPGAGAQPARARAGGADEP